MALDTRLDTALNMASLSMTSLQRCTTIVLSRCKSTYGADPRSCCTTFHASQSPSLRPAATSTLFASMDISTGGRGAPNESWKESRSSCGWTRSMPLGKMLHRYLTPEGMPPPPPLAKLHQCKGTLDGSNDGKNEAGSRHWATTDREWDTTPPGGMRSTAWRPPAKPLRALSPKLRLELVDALSLKGTFMTS